MMFAVARRDFEGMEQRRKRAARMFARGVTRADVARQLGVSRQSVSRWYADWQRGGSTALKAAGRAGRMPRLSAAQLHQVERALRRGPRAHGFGTDLWTLERVATVIETETGVRYHPGHVWKLLRDKLGWSRQRPARRAVERDDEAIARWGRGGVATDKKGARRRHAWIVFQDESGVSLLPPVRATWAPRGHTPVLHHRFNWKRLSMAAAVAYAHDRCDARIIFETRAGAYNDESLIEFLQALHGELDGAKVTLIWDGLPSHRSRRMQAWIRTQRRWLVVERLPGYAPDLNPVEGLWGNVKGRELANLCADSIDQPADAVHAGIDRIRGDAELASAFLRHCGLSP